MLFLTARDALDDKLRGFTLGGDDYMTKPFSIEELIVRVRAILRRVHAEPGHRRGARVSATWSSTRRATSCAAATH